jgi:hypothetical protein
MLIEPLLSPYESFCLILPPGAAVPSPRVGPPLHVLCKRVPPAQSHPFFALYAAPIDPPEEQSYEKAEYCKYKPIVFEGALIGVFGLGAAGKDVVRNRVACARSRCGSAVGYSGRHGGCCHRSRVSGS